MKTITFCNRRMSFVFRVLPYALFGVFIIQTWRLSSQEPFIHEPSPAPFDQNDLNGIAVDPDGRMVTVGRWREFHVGGSPNFPLVMIKDQADDPWTVLETPDFGWTWHKLEAVKFIPGTNGDFVAVGQYTNLLSGSRYGMLLRYYKEIDVWHLSSFNDPEAAFHFIRDFTFFPDNPNRILIVGTRGISDGGGNCFEFTTMVVDYDLDSHIATFLPTTTKGLLRSIVPLPNGNFFSVGLAAGDCDYLPWPIVLEVGEGVEMAHPNPPPKTPGFWYDLTGTILLADGKLFMVGHEAPPPMGGYNYSTLAYRYDPVTQVYESFKPLDPDTIPNFTNQLWGLEQSPDGRIFAVGRTHYTYTNLHYQRAMIQSFDGENWQLHPLPENFSQGHYSSLWDLAIHQTGQVYAAGLYREQGIYSPSTLILRTDEVSGVPQVDVTFSGVHFEMAGPNPFRNNTDLRFYIEDAAQVRLEVLDVLGKHIRLLFDQKTIEGWTITKWDGSDNHGKQLGSGVYFIRLSTPIGIKTLKVLKHN
jgi:hypothetical protein